MRITQPIGKRGSLKWIQAAINKAPESLDASILRELPKSNAIDWRSPLAADSFAEYRDADFLKVLGIEHLSPDLSRFWPERGPQWDALGVTDGGDVLLVEAKAHIDELCSPGTSAGEKSREKIAAALLQTAQSLGARPKAEWADTLLPVCESSCASSLPS